MRSWPPRGSQQFVRQRAIVWSAFGTERHTVLNPLGALDPESGAPLSLRTATEMPDSGPDLLDILLFSSLAILFVGFGFVAALEGWRRWSDDRRLRKHFQQ